MHTFNQHNIVLCNNNKYQIHLNEKKNIIYSTVLMCTNKIKTKNTY